MSILQANKVDYEYKNKYQKVRALNDVTLDFKRGNVYALVGKSGSGKSTLLSILGGLDSPTRGSVLFDNIDMVNIDKEKLRRNDISFIYQSYNLFPTLTAIENVAYPLWLNGVSNAESHKKARMALNRVGLGVRYLKRLPRQMSGGEQQRVAVARALVAQSRIILADEPTGNLDRSNSKRIFDLLAALSHEDNVMVVIATHDLKLASEADWIIQMEDGYIKSIEQGVSANRIKS